MNKIKTAVTALLKSLVPYAYPIVIIVLYLVVGISEYQQATRTELQQHFMIMVLWVAWYLADKRADGRAAKKPKFLVRVQDYHFWPIHIENFASLTPEQRRDAKRKFLSDLAEDLEKSSLISIDGLDIQRL